MTKVRNSDNYLKSFESLHFLFLWEDVPPLPPWLLTADPPVAASTSEMIIVNSSTRILFLHISFTHIPGIELGALCLYFWKRSHLCNYHSEKFCKDHSILKSMVWLEAVRPIPLNQIDSELNLQSFKGFLGFLASREALGLYLQGQIGRWPCKPTEETG